MPRKLKTADIRGDDMLKRIRACVDIRQWRDEVLGRAQYEIAVLARVHFTTISRLEKGMIAKNKRHWPRFRKAYQLEKYPNEFERLVKGVG